MSKRCPVCGSADIRTVDDLDFFYVCGGCCEMLEPDELVWLKTHRTRVQYALANGHDKRYGLASGA